MKRILTGGLVLIFLLSGCKKTDHLNNEPGIRFATAQEIQNMGGYAINEADFERVIKTMASDEKFLNEMKTLSGGGLEFPLPCDKLIGYIEELVGVDLSNVSCKARGKFMYKPKIDLWVAGNLAYAISLGGYIGAAGYAGFSGSIAGADVLGVLSIVYINNHLDTIMMSYEYGDEDKHVAFNAGFVIWTSETGGVTINITTDHEFSNGAFGWNPVLTASYQF
ncbi:MAG: hypothetical protein ABDH37_05610 [Candidatus Hydrothermales bacterium]